MLYNILSHIFIVKLLLLLLLLLLLGVVEPSPGFAEQHDLLLAQVVA